MRGKRLGAALLLSLVVLANVGYMLWRICFTLPKGEGLLSMFFAAGLLFAELLGLFELCVTVDGIHHQSVPPLPKVAPTQLPAVDVFVATYNEEVSLVRRTLQGCKMMEYPDPDKVHIYLCDDGKRVEMQALAAQMGVHYLARSGNQGAKAGNLNHALRCSGAPLIATFDADMIPTPRFLLETLPYFCVPKGTLSVCGQRSRPNEKKKAFCDAQKSPRAGKHSRRYLKKQARGGNGEVGFVQTPQSFYNPDLFQAHFFAQDRIPNEQDYFYRKVQLTKNHSNTVIYGGSNTVISRKALEAVGGFYEQSITEDFATGILIQSKGYQCYAIPTVLAAGLSPTDLKSLFAQRARWARGCIQTIQQLKIYRVPGLRLRQKLIYYSAISYWYSCVKRFFYLTAPIAFTVFGVRVVDCSLREVLLLFLPTYLLTNAVLVAHSARLRATHWTNIYETVFFPSLLGAVLRESVGRRQRDFSVTDKSSAVPQDIAYQRRKARVFYGYIVLSCVGIANLFLYSGSYQGWNFVVVLTWLVVNLLYLLMALLFVRGAKAAAQGKSGAGRPLAAQMVDRGCLLQEVLRTAQIRARLRAQRWVQGRLARKYSK
ncbi:MAG: cellulose synthase catalytic subunit [Faecalibacterium sp.]